MAKGTPQGTSYLSPASSYTNVAGTAPALDTDSVMQLITGGQGRPPSSPQSNPLVNPTTAGTVVAESPSGYSGLPGPRMYERPWGREGEGDPGGVGGTGGGGIPLPGPGDFGGPPETSPPPGAKGEPGGGTPFPDVESPLDIWPEGGPDWAQFFSGPGGGFGNPVSGSFSPGSNMLYDPFSVYEKMVPIMELNRDRNLMESATQLGLSGSRYGKPMTESAAKIGGETALAEDALLGQLLYDTEQAERDRWMQGFGLANQQLGIQNDWFQTLGALGLAEQQRADDFSGLAYNDWVERQRWALETFIPLLFGPGGEAVLEQVGGTAGLMDLVMAWLGGGAPGAFGNT